MKVGLLEKLIDAGFTKAEIMQLARDEPEQGRSEVNESGESAPENGSTAENGSAPENGTTAENGSASENGTAAENGSTNNAGTAFEDRLSGIEKTMNTLIKTIQAQNRLNDSFGSAGESLEEKTDKIMASIIRPEVKKG